MSKLSLLKDPVKIDTGYISGTLLGEPDKEVHVYRGIPYAAPPEGELRWKPPQPAKSWEGIRECTTFSSAPPQYVGDLDTRLNLPEDEDCLYLNVYTPAEKSDQKLPVMVWMHGGGYWAGSGNELMYNHFKLSQHGVVLVTVNMRLGWLGLLAHPLLSKESSNRVSGNYMFLDMIAALKWVQKNITAFGGNPGNVTIFGQSGGGAKVATMIASPLARGLFHRAICEGGAATAPIAPGKPLKDMEMIGKTVFAKLGVDKEEDPIAAARALPWKKLMKALLAITPMMNLLPEQMWDAAVDGWVLTDFAANTFQSDQQNVVSLITCSNLGEMTGPGMPMMPWLIQAYTRMLSSESKAGAKIYACVFDQIPAGWKREGCVSFHAIELPYVFGNVDIKRAWNYLYSLASRAGAKTSIPGVSDIDRKISEAMMKMWTQFARTGDPSISSNIKWPAWEQSSDVYLYVKDALQIKSGYSKLPISQI
jgi:para-nitrobenzyl esterase